MKQQRYTLSKKPTKARDQSAFGPRLSLLKCRCGKGSPSKQQYHVPDAACHRCVLDITSPQNNGNGHNLIAVTWDYKPSGLSL